MNKQHKCKQLEKYLQDTQRYRIVVDSSTPTLVIEHRGNAWYRVEGDKETVVTCCTFCGMKLARST